MRGQRGGVAEAAQRRSRDQAGLDAVDGDAVAGQLQRGGADETVDPGLARRIVREPRDRRARAGHRGGHQDAPGHAAAQGGKGGLGQPEAAFQVHRQGPFQGAFVQFREGALGKGSGVVQEDVQLAEALQGRAHRSSRGVVLAQVDGQQFGRASAQADRLQDGLAAAGGTRRQQNPGAFGGEAFGDGPADALAGAGDQCDAVLQAPHDGRSNSSPRQSRSRRSCSSTSSARVAGQVSAMLWNGVKSTPRLSR